MTESADPRNEQNVEESGEKPAESQQPKISAAETRKAAPEPTAASQTASQPATQTQAQNQAQNEAQNQAQNEAQPAAKSESQPEAPDQPEEPPAPDAQSIAAADAAVLAASRRHTRRSFVVAAAAAAAGYGFYAYLNHGPESAGQPELIREAFETNAAIAKGVFQEHVLAPTYPRSKAENLRVNGTVGLKSALVPETWRLQVVGRKDAAQHPRFVRDVTAWEYRYSDDAAKEDQGHDTKIDPATQTAAKLAPQEVTAVAMVDELHTGRKPRGREEAGESHSTLRPGTPGLLLTMEDILQLPRHELVTQFKCIEGWSQIVHWQGVRMADFLDLHPPEQSHGEDPKYVYMETPDGDYYTGYDLKTMRHPQALLVTAMMGAPLTQFHGAPLRLHLPMKYGYKQIKRIGLIAYTNDKPDDYWTKLGYDWYAGL